EAVGAGRQAFRSILFPVACGSRMRPVISELKAIQGGISVLYDDVQDVFMFGETDFNAGPFSVRSSARITWIKLKGRQLLSAAVIHGRSLVIDGVVELRSAGRLGYVLAEPGHGRLSIYSDAPASLNVSTTCDLHDVTINRCPAAIVDCTAGSQVMAG